MAEEQLAPEEGLEPNAAPEEGTEPPANDEPQTDPAIEALASRIGWAPKDQFRGPAEEWKPAEDFILAGREINRGLSRELKGMRDQLERVARVSAQITEDKVAERDAYWQGIQRKAVEDGNQELAERAFDERAKLKTAAPATETGPPVETTEFIERHSAWFGKDHLATMRAQEICDRLAKRGVPIPEQLREAERVIRREYPEHFPQAKQPASVNGPRTRTANLNSREKGFADMPAESQKMALDYERKHGVKKEDFAKSYWAEQANNERKVG